jgi:hypothetical protein
MSFFREKENPTPAHKWRLIEAIELANVVFGDRLEVTRTPTPARGMLTYGPSRTVCE